MKAIKLIIIFVVVLGGVLGAIYVVTSGGGDVTAPSPDTNVLPDTTTIEDTASSSAPLSDAQEESVVDPHREQDKTEGTPVKIDKDKPNTQHRYTCDICGPNMCFKTKKGLITHMRSKHNSSIGVTNTSFKCSECKPDKRFLTKKEYDKHMKAGICER